MTQSLKGGIDKFIISKKSDIVENSNNIASEFVNKNTNITYELDNDNNIINNDNTNSTDDLISGDKNLMNKKLSESNTFDIYDPRIWDSLDTNSKDLLIENDRKRDINIKFPLDQYN